MEFTSHFYMQELILWFKELMNLQREKGALQFSFYGYKHKKSYYRIEKVI